MVRARFAVCAMASLLCALGLRAQFEPKNPATLVVRVCIGSLQNPAPPNLSVQLQDTFGTIEREGHTDGRGTVEFNTFTATKRIRIFGPGIMEHEEVVEIESVETRKMVNVIVQEDTRGGKVSGAPGGSVPADRLNVPEKAQKEFQKASDSLGKKDWEDARKHFSAAIAIYDRYDVAYNGLGMALASSGSNQEARAAFEKAISLNENFSEAYRNLARISLSEKKFDEVSVLLAKSLSSDPLNAWALAYSAYAELQLHRFDQAVTHARKAHELGDKGLSSVHIVAALALESTGRGDEAASEYRTYLKEDPNGRDSGRAKEKLAGRDTSAPR